MPIQPPSSIPTQQPLTGPGLSRTRSLRRPQAGPSASASASAATATTTTAATGPGTGKRVTPPVSSVRAKATTTIATGPGIPNRNASPSRLPTKQAALSSTGTTSTTAGTRPRPPSATGSSGLASTRSRRSDGTAVAKAQSSATSASTGASSTARPFTKPPSSSRSHLISSGATVTNGTARPTSSGGLPSSHTSTASATTSSSTPSGQLSRTRSTTANTTSGPPPRGRTRTQSASIPSSTTTAAARLPSKPPGRQHSRPPSATTLSSATTLRPPSAQSTSTGSSSPASRPPTRSTSHSTSTTVSVTAAKKAPPITSHRRQWSGGAGTGASTAAQRDRPAFSTLQQHFSPAKNTAPKPRIAAILAPPASPSKKPANIVLSAETSRLQTTLLQLHLLHRNAAAVSAEWHTSARNALLGERFSALVAENEQLLKVASERAESANAAALQAWAEDGSGNVPLEEKIQVLDAVLAGVWSLAGQDVAASGQDKNKNKNKNKSSAVTSRYTLVVRRFERWAQQTAELVAARRGIDSLEALLETLQGEETSRRSSDGRSTIAAGAGFLSNEKEPLLDAAWHEECNNLTHRLEGWQQQLARLGGGVLGDSEARTARGSEEEDANVLQRQSSLHRILAGCSGLVDGMLEELQMMLQLEQDAAEQELAWIQRMNASVGIDTDSGIGNQNLPSHIARSTARAGSIWRTI